MWMHVESKIRGRRELLGFLGMLGGWFRQRMGAFIKDSLAPRGKGFS